MIIHSHWKGAGQAPAKKPVASVIPTVRTEQPQPVEEIKVEIVEEVVNNEVINKPPKKIKRVYFPQENKTIDL